MPALPARDLLAGLLLAGLPLAGCAIAGRGAGGAGDAGAATPAVSAPITDVAYEVRFDSALAAARTLRVTMRFATTGDAPVLLSLPAWTPGAYEMSWFARWVGGVEAEGDGRALRWERLDHDTWRLHPEGARRITLRFDYRADTLDNAMAWSRADFAFFNGTTVFPYPEGRPLAFPATVTIATEPHWRVATGMTPAGAPRTYREGDYHDLVDMPFFVGRFDLDSATIVGRTVRLASYPEGAIAGARRQTFWDHQRRMWPPMLAVTGDTAVRGYTSLVVVEPSLGGGGSALEHANSHLGIYGAGFVRDDVAFASITAHEIFHLWNVKRLRPADLWPYDYARPQPTALLWVSEGVTDYHADLALVRGGIVDSTGFLELMQDRLLEADASPPTALGDASLATWVRPIEGAYLYYARGALVGFLLDVLIRDASDGAGSLDTALRALYDATYRQGRGFTDAELWAALSRAAGGRALDAERRRLVEGREPLPWAEVLPLAGIRLVTDTLRLPVLGVLTGDDPAVARVTGTVPGGVAERAGVRPGDELRSLGDLRVVPGMDVGAAFRLHFAGRAGAPLPIVVRRAGRTLTLDARVEVAERAWRRLEFDPAAGERALRVRRGILTGG